MEFYYLQSTDNKSTILYPSDWVEAFRQTLVRNAVNFCKKRGENKYFTASLTKIHQDSCQHDFYKSYKSQKDFCGKLM